jgi:hypothetical protein
MSAENVEILYFEELLLMEGDLSGVLVTSSRVVRQQSLCSERLRRSYSVMRDIKFKTVSTIINL